MGVLSAKSPTVRSGVLGLVVIPYEDWTQLCQGNCSGTPPLKISMNPKAAISLINLINVI
jgi:hypothetical protein